MQGALTDPKIELYQNQVLIGSNDSWTDAPNGAEISASGLAPSSATEAVILTELPAGSYTAVVHGAGGNRGIALVEGYDLNPAAPSRFGNISTRACVKGGENVLITGVSVQGPEAQGVLIRALGPSLASLGVWGALADPVLDLRDGNGMSIALNDSWRAEQETQIQATGFAPSSEKEPATLVVLPPGNYTAIVSGARNGQGNALVELFALD